MNQDIEKATAKLSVDMSNEGNRVLETKTSDKPVNLLRGLPVKRSLELQYSASKELSLEYTKPFKRKRSLSWDVNSSSVKKLENLQSYNFPIIPITTPLYNNCIMDITMDATTSSSKKHNSVLKWQTNETTQTMIVKEKIVNMEQQSLITDAEDHVNSVKDLLNDISNEQITLRLDDKTRKAMRDLVANGEACEEKSNSIPCIPANLTEVPKELTKAEKKTTELYNQPTDYIRSCMKQRQLPFLCYRESGSPQIFPRKELTVVRMADESTPLILTGTLEQMIKITEAHAQAKKRK